jgi:hypothetical protein
MNEKVETFLKEYKEAIIECEKFCFMSRGKEFQQDAAEKLITIKQKAVSLKEEMINIKDEGHANIMLSMENLIDATINELKMWIAIKEEDIDKAWYFIITAQGAVRTALQSHNIATNFNGENYANKLYLLEKLLFPPQLFSSIEFIIKSAKCSICEKEYGECEHIVGKVYMGQMCIKIIEKSVLTGISYVDEPANKMARTISFTDGGITRDFMTWRVIEKNNSVQ